MLVNETVGKPESVLDLGPVAWERLGAAVRAMPERFWEHEDARKANAYACFHHTRHILFRFVERDAGVENYRSRPLWSVYAPLLMPIMEQATARYGFVQPIFPKAMLARLSAGGVIDRHRDGPGTHLATHKIHVPLQTNPQALFEAGGAILHLERGRAYEVNNIAPHGASNLGDEDRIHFIFEVCEGVAAQAAA